MFKVTLTKIKSTHNHLRTGPIEGVTPALPTKGQPFILFVLPLDESSDAENIMTTEVTAVDSSVSGRAHVFNTQNSTYSVEVSDESK